MSDHPEFLVAGAGFMGSGIAQTIAAHGHSLFLYDIAESQLAKARENIRWSVEKLHAKSPELWPDAETVLSRIHFRWDLDRESLRGVKAVIEAVAENLEIKTALFHELDRVCPQQTWFFSNTSAIPITRMARSSGRPMRFCGMHFFSPVPLMKLVEVIRGEDTLDEAVELACEWARSWGKTPVRVLKDTPGFIVNRLLIGMTLEAIRLVEEGIASVEDVDLAMKLGCGHRMGPLETADMAGLDVYAHAAQAIHTETGDSHFELPDLLRHKVIKGNLGRKTGKGFGEYNNLS